jgi:hypothetical protein
MSKKAGSYTVTFEEEDTSVLVLHGVIDGVLAKEIMAQTTPFTKSRPYVLSLCDLRDLETVTPEARKLFGEVSADGEGRYSHVWRQLSNADHRDLSHEGHQPLL